MIAKAASVAITRATNSRGWRPIAAATLLAASNVFACLRTDRLGTFFDPISNWDADLSVPHAADRDLNRKLASATTSPRSRGRDEYAPAGRVQRIPLAPRGAPICRHNSKPA